MSGSSLETNITHASNVTDSVGIPLDLKIGLTSAYVVIFLVALFGNSVGFYVVLIKKESSSRSVTNLFIGNMAVADLLLTITIMPFSVAFCTVTLFGSGERLVALLAKRCFMSCQFLFPPLFSQ